LEGQTAQTECLWVPRSEHVSLPLCILFSVLIIPALAYGLQITGLKGPQSFIADPDREQYFISNMNGDADASDNNGFITKLDGEGKLLKLEFIRGGTGKAVLHAPKGMAIIDRSLFVADRDAVRAFDTVTAEPVQMISLAQFGPVSLADIAHDGRGILYASDTQGDAIYKIDTTRGNAVSVLVKDPALSGPRGIAVHPTTGHVIVASWRKGKIFEVDDHGKLAVLVSNSFFSSRFNNLDGLDFDRFGNMYISDLTGGKVWRMRADQKFDVIAEFLNSPADISIDRKKHLILVPYLYGNAAEINGLESPVKSEKQKRTMADYGFGFMDKFKAQQKDKEEGKAESK
jgi:DNA-binding beta-propeller fold protein YncE